MSNRLSIYVDIGDEDGPSISYIIDNKTKVGKYGLKVICNNCESIYGNGKHFFCHEEAKLSNIIEKYNVNDFMEVHDWYDFIHPNEAKKKEKELNKSFDKPKLPKNKNINYVQVTINQYSVLPRKYLIPQSVYTKIPQINVFIKKMAKYEVIASYKQILLNYNVIDHNYYIYDLIDEEDDVEAQLY